MYDTAKTVELRGRIEESARNNGYKIRTHARKDGVVAYELVDQFTGKIKARSRNYRRVAEHFKRQIAR